MHHSGVSVGTLFYMSAPAETVFRRLLRLVAIPDFQEDATSRNTVPITETFTGRELARIPVGTRDDALAAIARARRAQAGWAALTPRARAEVFDRFSRLILARRDGLLDLIQAETGKSRASAQEEVLDVSITARYYAHNGPKLLRPRRAQGMIPGLTKTRVHHVPRGVVGVISPWNYPLTLAVSDAIAALMAGNGVVIKPDSQTPFTCLAAVELLHEAGLPRDLFLVVPGPGREVGTALAENTEYLMFTGSTATGRVLGRTAGERLIGYSAELGGKNAMIVTEGADVKKVAEVATRGMFSNGGQLCISIERVYVERGIAARLETALADRIGAMKLGASYGFDMEMGSLISQDQLDTVTKHVEDAVAKGARVVIGGRARPDLGPLFYEPTILADVPETATARCEETFGPVVSLYPVASVEEAVARANDTDYGLNASVFAADTRQGEAIARRLRAGTVNVDEGYVAGWGSVDAPMGGMGVSGVGRRHGAEGLLKYTEAQTIAVQRLIHFGGPSFVPRAVWQRLLPPLVGMMRWLPGR